MCSGDQEKRWSLIEWAEGDSKGTASDLILRSRQDFNKQGVNRGTPGGRKSKTELKTVRYVWTQVSVVPFERSPG